ncbi:hypothetical protein BDV93DRAFT_158913 [Ceratobasidium sp. AG-I]|nr:hypothetical protein BDV93DRAFT_158913 [Ceratobasidium sp. AG-I]
MFGFRQLHLQRKPLSPPFSSPPSAMRASLPGTSLALYFDLSLARGFTRSRARMRPGLVVGHNSEPISLSITVVSQSSGRWRKRVAKAVIAKMPVEEKVPAQESPGQSSSWYTILQFSRQPYQCPSSRFCVLIPG